MLFSKTMIHGVYVLCYLSRKDPQEVVPAAPIAEAMNVPPEQAAKILQALARAEIIRSVRGRKGGYSLSKPLSETSVTDVMEALGGDESERIPGSRPCPVDPTQDCQAHAGLTNLYRKVREFLSKEMMESLVTPNCEVTDEAFIRKEAKRNDRHTESCSSTVNEQPEDD